VSGQTNRIPDCVTDCQRFNTTYATTSLGKKSLLFLGGYMPPISRKQKPIEGWCGVARRQPWDNVDTKARVSRFSVATSSFCDRER